MMRGIILVLLVSFLQIPSVCFAEKYDRPVRNMSIEDIKNERYGIIVHQKYVKYMSTTAEGIRDGACNSYWRGAMRAKDELAEIPAGLRNHSYRLKRAAKEKENQDYLNKYEKCFSRELRRYPEIYNNELDPARSYKEFESVYDRLASKLNGYAARFHELGQELKARGAG